MEATHANAANGLRPPGNEPFTSNLSEPSQRFLAYAIEHSLKQGRRSARDFIRHFPPKAIMEGLADQPELRAEILVPATGMRLKVAIKKDAASCGNDLQIALDERETTAETVVSLFLPDDRVRFLDSRALWSFLIEDEFWQMDKKKDAKAHAVAAEHMTYWVERALEERVLTTRDVVNGITVTTMAELLPRAELPKIIGAALGLGHAKKPFLEKDLLAAVGIATLAEHIPLPTIWTRVVVPYIAEAHGLVRKSEDKATAEEAKAEVRGAPPAGSKPFVPARQVTPPAISAQPNPAVDTGLDIEVDDLLSSLTSGKAAPKRPLNRPGSVPPSA